MEITRKIKYLLPKSNEEEKCVVNYLLFFGNKFSLDEFDLELWIPYDGHNKLNSFIHFMYVAAIIQC